LHLRPLVYLNDRVVELAGRVLKRVRQRGLRFLARFFQQDFDMMSLRDVRSPVRSKGIACAPKLV
jgi:hypothetical protein